MSSAKLRIAEVGLFGCGLLAQRRIIDIASGTIAVESLDVPPVERRSQREPARQIGIRQEKLAKGDRVRLAGGQSRFGLFARKTLVGDIDPAERRLERGSQPRRRARFARADEEMVADIVVSANPGRVIRIARGRLR